MKMLDLQCAACAKQRLDVLVRDDGVIQPCECGGTMGRIYLPTNRPTVLQDTIEGGLLITNGLCNPDGSPKRYYSRSEIRKAAEKAGMTNYVTHVPAPGTDKSTKTTRWV